MYVPRILSSSTLLKDGNVLILAGCGDQEYGHAELYNNNSRIFKVLWKVSSHKSVPITLPNGRVFIIGNGILEYNPRKKLSIKKINISQFSTIMPKVILLDNKRIFICDGEDGLPEPSYVTNFSNTKVCAIYDTEKNELIKVLKFKDDHDKEDAVLLPDGNVLIINNKFYQIYNPKTNDFYNYRKFDAPSYSNNLLKLNNGKILVITHVVKEKKDSVIFGYYDTKKNIITPIKLNTLIYGGFETVGLPDGNVLLIGASVNNRNIEESNKGIYLLDTKNNMIKYLGNMRTSRKYHTCTLLKDKKSVLIIGGTKNSSSFDGGTLKSTELFVLK